MGRGERETGGIANAIHEPEACTAANFINGGFRMSLKKDLLKRPFDQAIIHGNERPDLFGICDSGTCWPGMV